MEHFLLYLGFDLAGLLSQNSIPILFREKPHQKICWKCFILKKITYKNKYCLNHMETFKTD